MTKTHTHSTADLSCAADFLDDIEVDESGKCEWTAVANAQTHIRAVLRCWSAAEPQSSTDSEAFRDALEQLAAVARTAVSYVDYANYSKRAREAQSWIRKKHEELLASVLSHRTAAAQPRLSAETAIAALAKRFWSIHPSTLDAMGLTREEFYASEMVKLFGALTRNEPQEARETVDATAQAVYGALECLANDFEGIIEISGSDAAHAIRDRVQNMKNRNPANLVDGQ